MAEHFQLDGSDWELPAPPADTFAGAMADLQRALRELARALFSLRKGS